MFPTITLTHNLLNGIYRFLFFIFQVNNLNYDSDITVLFMRGSVIATDLLLIAATWLYLSVSKLSESQQMQAFALVVFNAGLLLVDHVHFQYNGVLMGLLVLCIYCAQAERYVLLAAAFSVLVLMKHLFVPLAPVFAVFLIQRHCFVKNSTGAASFSVVRFLQLASVAAAALGAALGPFLLQSNGVEQMLQIFARLFPFGRGLVHAYWAPNFWALYCFADKLAPLELRKVSPGALSGLQNTTTSRVVNSTSGIVGDFAFNLLPPVSAATCMIILLVSLLPALYVLHRKPSVPMLIKCLVYASLSCFMWGYHVHEKAIIIPMILQIFVLFRPAPAEANQKHHPAEMMLHKTVFGLLVIAGTYSLFPLFFTLPELVTKCKCYVVLVNVYLVPNIIKLYILHFGPFLYSSAMIFAAYTAGAWVVIFSAGGENPHNKTKTTSSTAEIALKV